MAINQNVFYEDANTHNIYLYSKKVKVFPCSYRGYFDGTALTVLNPEARLNTEFNFRHAGGTIGNTSNTSSYIISWENTNASKCLRCVIGGYYFELLDITPEDFVTAGLTSLNICTRQINLGADDTTQVLNTWSDPEASSSVQNDLYLDTLINGLTVNDGYIFTGLRITGDEDTVPVGTITLKIIENDALNQKVLLPEIYHGSGVRSIWVGSSTIASGSNSFAEGEGTTASGINSHAEGEYTTASGLASHAEGGGTTASSSYAHAEGEGTTASGMYSHASGYYTTAAGEGATAIGKNTRALGNYSFSSGGSYSNPITIYIPSGASATTTQYTTQISSILRVGNVLYCNDIYAYITNIVNDSSTGIATITVSKTFNLSGTDPVTAFILTGVALGLDAAVLGCYNVADGPYTVATGYETIALGSSAHSEGNYTSALGNNAHAEGYVTTASGDYSHAEGRDTVATGAISHAEGKETVTYGNNSHAEGFRTITGGSFESNTLTAGTGENGAAAHAEGNATIAQGVASHAEGEKTFAKGKNSHAEGKNTIATNTDAHAEGFYTKATGIASHAEGGADEVTSGTQKYVEANGTFSHAEGQETIARSKGSHAEGYKTVAGVSNTSGIYSHAEGGVTNALGAYSHAEGYYTTALGQGSHTEGGGGQNSSAVIFGERVGSGTSPYIYKYTNTLDANIKVGRILLITINNTQYYVKITGIDTTNKQISFTTITSNFPAGTLSSATIVYGCASSSYSHVEGYYNNASGNYAHAEGYNNIASNTSAHAEGYQTQATGSYAHAEGYNTKATGNYSHAEGYFTTADRSYQHVFGKYNNTANDSNLVEMVGWGAATAPYNIRTLDQSGNEVLTGTITCRGFSTVSDYAPATDMATIGMYLGHSNEINFSSSGSSVYFGYRKEGTNAVNTYIFCNSTGGGGYGAIQAGTFHAMSDARLKENITEYKSEKSILDLPIYKFDFINGTKNQIGCLAQDLQEICPEIVHEGQDGYLSIQESKLVYLLLDEVKKLKKEIAELKK